MNERKTRKQSRETNMMNGDESHGGCGVISAIFRLVCCVAGGEGLFLGERVISGCLRVSFFAKCVKGSVCFVILCQDE